MLKRQLYLPVLLLLSLTGCDTLEDLASRLFDDPTRAVRITTKDGHSVVLLQPELDYLRAIGAGRYDRAAFVEGRGLRAVDGIVEWADFTAMSVGRSRRLAEDTISGSETVYEADVRLTNGSPTVRQLIDTPARGLRGWRKADDLPATFGYVRTEIPLRRVARIEILDSVRQRIPDLERMSYRITAHHREQGTCEGEANLYHPLPRAANVQVSHDDRADGVWVEAQGMLLEIDLRDIRKLTIGEHTDGKATTRITFHNGDERTYPVRNAYFRMQGPDIACQRISLFDLRSIVVSASP